MFTFEKVTASCPDQSLYDLNSHELGQHVADHPCST